MYSHSILGSGNCMKHASAGESSSAPLGSKYMVNFVSLAFLGVSTLKAAL